MKSTGSIEGETRRLFSVYTGFYIVSPYISINILCQTNEPCWYESSTSCVCQLSAVVFLLAFEKQKFLAFLMIVARTNPIIIHTRD